MPNKMEVGCRECRTDIPLMILDIPDLYPNKEPEDHSWHAYGLCPTCMQIIDMAEKNFLDDGWDGAAKYECDDPRAWKVLAAMQEKLMLHETDAK